MAAAGRQLVNGEIIHLDGVSPARLATDLDEHGVVRLSEVFSQEWLAAMRASVADAIADHGEGDFYLDHADHQIGSPAHRLVSNPAVRRLFAQTTSLRRPHAGNGSMDDDLRCSMLVRAGTARTAPSNMFHYDPCVLTMVIPIFIPQAPFGTGGELAAVANTRPFRRYLGTHLLETLVTHNGLCRRYVARKVREHPEKYVVALQPGDAYLFWGYRTFHGNLPCAPGLLRTTLVLKYGRVHSASSWASKVAWTLSRSRRDLHRFQYLPPLAASPELLA